jgi:hypothetical protein
VIQGSARSQHKHTLRHCACRPRSARCTRSCRRGALPRLPPPSPAAICLTATSIDLPRADECRRPPRSSRPDRPAGERGIDARTRRKSAKPLATNSRSNPKLDSAGHRSAASRFRRRGPGPPCTVRTASGMSVSGQERCEELTKAHRAALYE